MSCDVNKCTGDPKINLQIYLSNFDTLIIYLSSNFDTLTNFDTFHKSKHSKILNQATDLGPDLALFQTESILDGISEFGLQIYVSLNLKG